LFSDALLHLTDHVAEVERTVGHHPDIDVRVVQSDLADRPGPAQDASELQIRGQLVEPDEHGTVGVPQRESLDRHR
jgi:hypothetical protein